MYVPAALTAGTAVYRTVQGVRHNRPRELSQAANGVVAAGAGVGGSAAGALIGSVFGPVGTVAGGFIGSVVASWGSEEIGNVIIDKIHDDEDYDDEEICERCRGKAK